MAMQLNHDAHSGALNGETSAWLSDPPAARPSYCFGGHLPAALEPLQSKKQWLTWDYIWNAGKGRWDKLPCSAHTGRPASINKSANFGTFAEAAATAARLKMAGVGFLLTNDDGITGIDLDHCITDGGSLSDLAAEVNRLRRNIRRG
jgi:primase-polymerase (primpol)-like protein